MTSTGELEDEAPGRRRPAARSSTPRAAEAVPRPRVAGLHAAAAWSDTSPRGASSSATTDDHLPDRRRAGRARHLRRDPPEDERHDDREAARAPSSASGTRPGSVLQSPERGLARGAPRGGPAGSSTATTTSSSSSTDSSTRRPSPSRRPGPIIERMPNLVKFVEDPDAMLVMALEECDPTSGTAVEGRHHAPGRGRAAPRQSPRYARPRRGSSSRSTSKGEVDLRLHRLALRGRRGPQSSRSWETSSTRTRRPGRGRRPTSTSRGTSGRSSSVAEAAGPEYARNAEALRAVQPEDVLPGEIDANLGAPWIPESDIQAFAAELFGVPPLVDRHRAPQEGRPLERRGRL